MAENKKYYWLKLQHDFFGSKRIKKLRRLEDGDACVIIYLKMQLKSIKNEGVLVYSGLEDSFEEELALDLDEDVEIVKRTVRFLLQFGLLEISDDQTEYTVPYAKQNIGSETQAAGRMREFRKKHLEPGMAEHSENVKEQSEHDVIPEKIKDVEKPKQEKPKRETVIQVYDRLTAEEFRFSPEIDEKMRCWLKYKMERKESYKETGLHSLLKQVQKNIEMFGEVAVCDLIETCMGSNWAGIIWDKLAKGNYRTKSDRISSRVSEVDGW